jgi:hypothetical protein
LLAGRVPANVAALIMKSKEGEELSCKASNFEAKRDQVEENRGVISYYATQTLPIAKTMGGWLKHIENLISKDYEKGRLSMLKKPDLTVIGDLNTILPGESDS